MKSSLLIVIVILFAGSTRCYSQADSTVSSELRFLAYLTNNGDFEDALSVAGKIRAIESLMNESQKDSLNFITGWSFYQLKNSQEATSNFERVGINSPLYNKAYYYGIFNRIYAKDFSGAEKRIAEAKDTTYRSLRQLQLAGIKLLQKDYSAFDSIADGFQYDHYAMIQEEKELKLFADTLRRYPKKSALAAGIFSAILPGSGKVYAGKMSQGIAAFLEIAALGGAAAEYYVRSGPESAGFIVFGTLFSFFYIGNIWGSAISVRVNKNDFYKKIDNNIMVDIHVPLRRIFE